VPRFWCVACFAFSAVPSGDYWGISPPVIEGAVIEIAIQPCDDHVTVAVANSSGDVAMYSVTSVDAVSFVKSLSLKAPMQVHQHFVFVTGVFIQAWVLTPEHDPAVGWPGERCGSVVLSDQHAVACRSFACCNGDS
jgi:hypothetical protein